MKENCGCIEAICGPMFSGKTEELIRRLRRASIASKKLPVFKPAIDNRYSETEIVSHSDVRMESEGVGSVHDILARVQGDSFVIGIDEANFFGQGLVEVVEELANQGRQVIVAGLDTDYLGRPFPPMPDLLAIASSITKLHAICVQCGKPGTQTQRLVRSDKLIVVGAAEAYQARCRQCFQPGEPMQGSLDFWGVTAQPVAIET